MGTSSAPTSRNPVSRHSQLRERRLCHDGTVNFSVQVEVMLREGIADPQGQTIERSLPTLGFPGVAGVRVGKLILFTIDAPDEESARAEVDNMCHRFLTNPVIEDSSVTVTAVASADA